MPEIHVGNPDKNRKILEKVIRECFDQYPGIDIAVAPELANVGFHLIEYEFWKKHRIQKTSFEIRQLEGGNSLLKMFQMI